MNGPGKKFRYPGIRPFEQQDSNEFFGRDNDKAAFLQILQQEKSFVLYGKSGLGKTSLLRAGLLPAFQQQFKSDHPDGSRPVFTYLIRLGIKQENDTTLLLHKIDDIICKVDGLQFLQTNSFLPANAASNPWHHFKNRQIELRSRGQEPLFVIVFDQFEELFTYSDNELYNFKIMLAELLGEHAPVNIRNYLGKKELDDDNSIPRDVFVLGQSGLPVKIIFSIRSDKYNLLNRLKDAVPNINKHAYELLPLDTAQARQAIENPAAIPDEVLYCTKQYAYDPGVTDKILSFLVAKTASDRDYSAERNYIEPYCLQIICSYLETAIIFPEQKRTVSADDVEDLGQIIELYYTRAIEQLKLEYLVQEKVFDLLEEEMIYKKDNRRLIIYENILLDKFGIDPDLLKQLTETRLIREENYSSGGKSYEISHDALVLPILQARIKRKHVNKETADEINDPALLQYNQEIMLKPNDYYGYKRRGEYYSYKGYHDKAIKDYTRAIELNSTDIDLYNSLGRVYREAGDDQRALDVFDMAIQHDPQFIYAYLNKGFIYYKHKDYQNAIEQFNEVIRINPDSAEAYNNLGMVAEDKEAYPQALVNYDKAIKIDKQYLDPILNRGNVYFKMGEKTKAKEAYEQVLTLNPSYSKAHFNIGIYFFAENQYDTALSYFNKTLQLDPTDEGAKQNIAYTYAAKGDLDHALSWYEQVTSTTDLMANDLYELGYLFYNKNKFEKASQCFQRALAIQDNEENDALLMLGLSLMYSGQLADSLRSFTKLIQLNPSNAKAYINIGLCYEKLNQLEAARENYRKAIEMDPGLEQSYNNLSLSYINNNQSKEAIPYLEMALKRWPENDGFHNMLGKAYIDLDKLDAAEEHLNTAIQLNPDYELALNNLGIVADYKKDYSTAIHYFQQAIDINNEMTIAYNNLINVYEKATVLGDANTDTFTAADYCYIGAAYDRQKKSKEAENCFLKCINKDPAFMLGYFNLGLINFNKPEKAIGYFLKAYAIDPDNINILIALGDTYVELNDYDNAEKSFLKAENLFEKNEQDPDEQWAIYNGLGNVQDGRNQYLQAYDFYQKAMSLNQDNEIIYNNLGYVTYKLGKLDEAITYNEESIRLSPDYGSPYDNLGSIYQQKKDFKKAFEYFQKAISLNPDDAVFFADLGLLYTESAQYDRALDHFQRSLKLNPDLPAAWYGIGLVSFYKKEYAIAAVNFKKANKCDKFFKLSYIKLGEIAEQMNSAEEEADFYEQAQKIAPDDAYIKIKQAGLFVRTGNLEKAIEILERLRSESQTLPPPVQSLLFEKLGDIELAKGNKVDAIMDYTSSFMQDNYNETVLKKMIDFYQSQNNREEADVYFKKLEEIQVLKNIP